MIRNIIKCEPAGSVRRQGLVRKLPPRGTNICSPQLGCCTNIRYADATSVFGRSTGSEFVSPVL